MDTPLLEKNREGEHLFPTLSKPESGLELVLLQIVLRRTSRNQPYANIKRELPPEMLREECETNEKTRNTKGTKQYMTGGLSASHFCG